jgi:hypothetical protein
MNALRYYRPVLLTLPVLGLASLRCHGQTIVVTGRLVNSEEYPIAHAPVRVSGPANGVWLDSAFTDSAGTFFLTIPFQAGCYRLQGRMIGYGVTERTFAVSTSGARALGVVRLREAPVPEWPALLLMGCAYPGAGAWGGAWETDTVRVVP